MEVTCEEAYTRTTSLGKSIESRSLRIYITLDTLA